MGLELLSNHFGRVALIRAGDRVTTTFGVMSWQSIEAEIFGAVATGDEPFGAFDRLVLHHLLSADLLAALVVAVDRFHGAGSNVTLRCQENKRTRGKTLK